MTKIKPVFRTSESEIEKIIEEKAKAIEEKNIAEIQALRKQLEEEEREAQRQKEEKEREAQRQKEEKERLEQMAKIAEEKARQAAEEQAKKIAEEQAKKIAEEKARQAAEEQAKKIEESKGEVVRPAIEGSSSKIAKMIEEIKKRRSTIASAQPSPTTPMVPTVDRYKTSVPIISPEQAVDDEDMIKCPTCHTGHVHALKSDGLVYKCTGPDCNEEFVMVPKTAGYKCAGCGGPIKRPEDPKYNLDACPFCGGKKAVKFNWGKLWKAK